MTKEHLQDPVYWAQRFQADPIGATVELAAVLTTYGYLDLTSFWRQFYDEHVGFTFFRWNSLLVYVAGCGVMYAVIRRRDRGPRPVHGFVGYLLPAFVRQARSFRVDLQFYLIQLVKIPSLMVVPITALFLVHVMPGLFRWLSLYDRQPLRGLTSGMDELPLGWKMFVVYWVVFLAREFGYYWMHRLYHSSNLLWQFHKVHHYGGQMSLLTNARVHPVDSILAIIAGNLTGAMALASLFRFNPSDGPHEVVLAKLVAVYWWPLPVTAAFWVMARFSHTHVPLSLGPVVDRIVVTPAVHIVHHARDIRASNFGGFLSIWDTVFGTFRRHDFRQPLPLGVEDMGDGYYKHCVQAMVEPFVSAWRLIRVRPTEQK